MMIDMIKISKYFKILIPQMSQKGPEGKCVSHLGWDGTQYKTLSAGVDK